VTPWLAGKFPVAEKAPGIPAVSEFGLFGRPIR
jgi:hypothetical protein